MLRALCLLSGGLDSSAALALARREGILIELALTFDYGQKAVKKELEAAMALAKHFGIAHHSLELPWFKELKNGGLSLPGIVMPQFTRKLLDDPTTTANSANRVWVPNRNGVFIEIAACLAEDREMDKIIVGFNREEAATFPDNSAGYLETLNQSLAFSTRGKVQVVSPTLLLSKPEIVASLVKLSFPFEKLWSCYENGEQMCGDCESCQRLKRGLQDNKLKYGGLFAN